MRIRILLLICLLIVATGGRYTRRYGRELVTNGTFTGNADGWTVQGVGSGWYYNSNAIRRFGFIGDESATQSINISPGKRYLVTWDVSFNIEFDTLEIVLGGTSVESSKSVGSYSAVIRAGSSDTLIAIRGVASTPTMDGAVDNVSVKALKKKGARYRR